MKDTELRFGIEKSSLSVPCKTVGYEIHSQCGVLLDEFSLFIEGHTPIAAVYIFDKGETVPTYRYHRYGYKNPTLVMRSTSDSKILNYEIDRFSPHMAMFPPSKILERQRIAWASIFKEGFDYLVTENRDLHSNEWAPAIRSPSASGHDWAALLIATKAHEDERDAAIHMAARNLDIPKHLI